ncbi:nucleotide exchange factor GrpE [Acholeplasma sp. OttesenSCG-928-E16]|nr:nucleotide exchange factor GrpE [Acholeplasma sp. OttesenSCG-928-E16]
MFEDDKKEDILDKESDIKNESPPLNKKEKKDKNKETIIKLQLEIDSLNDKLLRAVAELENFKKRTNQERIIDRKYASSNLIDDLLVPLDQLMKISNLKTDNEVLNNFLVGFKMINDQIFDILENDGLKPIEAVGKPFDPNFHHALEKASDKEKENGIVLEETQKGYLYKDRILRPSMVKVNEWEE